MIGATALHTRAKCDECRVRTATACEAPCTGCGTSSDVGTQSAPRPLLDFDAEVSALEARGFAPPDDNSKSVAAST